MTYSKIPHLRSVPSAGYPGTFSVPHEDGVTTEHEKRVTPCGGCQHVTVEGDEITKYRRTWWHKTCAEKDIAAGNPGQAWLALGHDLARSPRSYNVGESRAIVGALLAMIYDPTEWEDLDYSPAIGGQS